VCKILYNRPLERLYLNASKIKIYHSLLAQQPIGVTLHNRLPLNYLHDCLLICNLAEILRMKKTLLIIAVLLIGFSLYWFVLREKKTGPDDEKAGPMIAKKHSAAFNSGIDSLMTTYFSIKDAFVNADSTTAKAACSKLILLSDSSRLFELKTDSAAIYESALLLLGDVKANAESLVNQTDLTEMRQDFRMIGESLYPLLKTIHYEGDTLYWQNCPMAFGDNKEANWISNSKEIVNPYLGKNHPEFKGSMLHCGEVKDIIKAK